MQPLSKSKVELENTDDPFARFFDNAEQRPDYWVERAKLEFTREILTRMKQTRITKGDLARKLGVRPGMITRLLSGRNNFELSTMVRIAMAVDCRFSAHLVPSESKKLWQKSSGTRIECENISIPVADNIRFIDFKPKKEASTHYAAKPITA